MKQKTKPAVGQVWQSMTNGHLIKVIAVDVSPCGFVHVSAINFSVGRCLGWNPMPYTYADGLAQWHRRIREENRYLL